jgi:hypothetical protein
VLWRDPYYTYLNVSAVQVPTQSQPCQVPDDRNKMSEAEVSAVSVDIGGGSSAATRAGTGAQPVAPAGSAAARMLNMEPGLELRLAAFMCWAGPTMLAALGMAPGNWGPRLGGGLQLQDISRWHQGALFE